MGVFRRVSRLHGDAPRTSRSPFSRMVTRQAGEVVKGVTTSASSGQADWFPGAEFGYGGTSTPGARHPPLGPSESPGMNRSPPRPRTLLDSRALAAPGWKHARREP
ncbi:hypothetical protein ASNO1_61160 [Corallococcus caeni]|uniref:Uncharacterized protein n=1 Tax=Corallococcus caeni TaxID=3082388 RepID=A0ABQ6R199_9BACT|nr:hypothetical protein ASNO1_61160 [Corallococcus sp. NO1]